MSWYNPRIDALRLAVLFTLAVAPVFAAETALVKTISVLGSGISAGEDSGAAFRLVLGKTNNLVPFNQSAIKQGTEAAQLGPRAGVPFFVVRFAMPVPPENDTNLTGFMAGVDPKVMAHNHSPGLEIMPNGDVLAVYFTAATSRGPSECANTNSFVQARLRYGAEQWDLPELFFDFEGYNDQSALLWNDNGTIRFFGGGREASPMMPFKMAASTNSGETWSVWLPVLDKPATDYTAQPINSAFRGSDGAMYVAMDAAEDQSFLWRSPDGIHWHDQGGRTGARHSTILPLDARTLISLGGKNASVNGWTPQNLSTNFGETWSTSTASVFPALGGNQRPQIIRLANGHLFYATDSYIKKSGKSPEGWTLGQGSFVAVSTNSGADWHIKKLPVGLPHHEMRNFDTLGYVTARQAPNGVIHVLSTMTQPCLHYELNEAWVFSDAGETPVETTGGEVKKFSEKYPNGKLRAEWSARILPGGRYLLDGKETDCHASGAKQHQVTYQYGRKTGQETFWSAEGKVLWKWDHDLKRNRSVLTQYWPNGQKKVESTWNTRPEARDKKITFFGLVADGPVRNWNEDGSLKFSGAFTNGLLNTNTTH